MWRLWWHLHAYARAGRLSPQGAVSACAAGHTYRAIWAAPRSAGAARPAGATRSPWSGGPTWRRRR